jgi:hypothetical protein
VAADHPKHCAWGGLSATLIVKEHCMARKTACHVLQITSDQNQEVLDSSPKFGISFFPERVFGSGISSASKPTTPIPSIEVCVCKEIGNKDVVFLQTLIPPIDLAETRSHCNP